MRITDLLLRVAASRYGKYIIDRRTRIAKLSKLVFSIAGGFLLALSALELVGLLSYSGSGGPVSLALLFVIVALLLVLSAGYVLLTLFPGSWRVKFLERKPRESPQEVFGFWTLIGVGIGSTLGSPLFVLVPDNIVQYGFVSVLSLILAAFISIGLSAVYSKSTLVMKKSGMEVVGGPSFVSGSIGVRNIRYFLSRFAAAIANTALAAYSAVLFADFDLQVLPQLLNSSGVQGAANTLVVLAVLVFLVAWLAINLLFSNRFLRKIALIQSALVLIMGIALLGQILVFFGHSSPMVIFPSLQINTVEQVFLDTGYLYIIYFGFQEILMVERESRQQDYIINFWQTKKFRVTREFYVPAAMILTVIVSATFNILFALSVFYLSPAGNTAQQTIPALYLAGEFGGAAWEGVLSLAFLIASVTTLVPAYIAASRHISSMSRDGFLPMRVSRTSYLIVIVLIFVLYFQPASFLIGITDFMILTGLAINCFSLYWLLRLTHAKSTVWRTASILVGTVTLLLGFSVYFITQSVVEAGILAIFMTYLIYDALELGPAGSQIFIAVGTAIMALVTFSFPVDYTGHLLPGIRGVYLLLGKDTLPLMLSLSALLLVINLFIDGFLIRKYDLRRLV